MGTHAHSFQHCPYCLHLLQLEATDEVAPDSLEDHAARRATARQNVRRELVERLRKASPDGQIACPVCGHQLNKNDEALLLSQENFRCHRCSHDLATYAYRQEAYGERRWLPVIYGLADLNGEEKCGTCSLAGALARACQNAMSAIPKYYPVQSKLLVDLLARTEWNPPDTECQETCFALRQYEATAAERMTLL